MYINNKLKFFFKLLNNLYLLEHINFKTNTLNSKIKSLF